jgi:dTDP-4-amino-4,6-dideoxygalactose transaminase
MQKEMIRLSRPDLSENALQQVLDVLDTGMLVQGKWVKNFEQQLANYLEVDHCVLVSNGTAALHLSLLVAGIGKGDEVIVPAYTFTAVANTVELTGATPIFVDIQLHDCCMDVRGIESKINANTKAIIAVHEFGFLSDIAFIQQLASKYSIKVIEDAACALGSSWQGKKAGTTGFTGCFSFHPRKILTTGEGGAIVTSDADVAEKLRQLRNHGMDYSSGAIDFALPGFNYRMTDFQAALGPDQLLVLDDVIAENNRQANYYQSHLHHLDGLHLPVAMEGSVVTYQTYHLMFDDTEMRRVVKEALTTEGIESNIGAYAIPFLKYYQHKYKSEPEKYSNALAAYQRGLAIPLGVHLDDEDLNLIVSTIQKAMKNGNG